MIYPASAKRFLSRSDVHRPARSPPASGVSSPPVHPLSAWEDVEDSCRGGPAEQLAGHVGWGLASGGTRPGRLRPPQGASEPLQPSYRAKIDGPWHRLQASAASGERPGSCASTALGRDSMCCQSPACYIRSSPPWDALRSEDPPTFRLPSSPSPRASPSSSHCSSILRHGRRRQACRHSHRERGRRGEASRLRLRVPVRRHSPPGRHPPAPSQEQAYRHDQYWWYVALLRALIWPST